MTDDRGPDPTPDDDRSRRPRGDRRFANLVALAFVVVLALGAFWLIRTLMHYNDVLNCVAAGRRNCEDVVR